MASIIIKTVERCNINCSYCYFFNKKDKSFEQHSPYISLKVINQLFDFLSEGAKTLSIKNFAIVFHGGEPLMQNKETFDYMCKQLRGLEKLNVSVDFSLQTNLMLLDKQWIDLFNKHTVSLGISIDGPKDIHDKYRLDKRGKGTFERVIDKIKFLQSQNTQFGKYVLSVINPIYSPKNIFQFFYEKLKINQFDFLLPDNNWDDKPAIDVKKYGTFICDLFDLYVQDNNKSNIKIRLINSILSQFFGNSPLIYGLHNSKMNDAYVHPITISSDGFLSPVDDLRNTDPKFINTKHDIFNTKYSDYLKTEIFQKLKNVIYSTPKNCNNCCWEKVCGGGNILHRYNTVNGFNNSSVYCEALKDIYSHVASYLIKKGYPLSKMESLLELH